ncbi:hypothetical protein CMI37_36715 [Candidatus Pacearchaeota archaeon]|nr:hypothetical protein [Candidatus Pacearchaeota archaeon]|tara:strand:+ start:3144 stop:3560 length:417 start_codon:yes stop_codon:yes gene_type:complete
MAGLPETILHPKKFRQSLPPGYDGAFDWSWTDGCFGNTTIAPMDIDGVVERHGRILVFETKDVGVEVKKGQLITLTSLYKMGDFTVMFIWGKTEPETVEVWYPPPYNYKRNYTGVAWARKVVAWWFEYASAKPMPAFM